MENNIEIVIKSDGKKVVMQCHGKNTTAEKALEQIKEKQYDAEMTGEVCYVGLAHCGKRSCIRWTKNG